MNLFKAAIFAACLAVPTISTAAPKVYSGSEAQAIRCAQLVFFVASEGDRQGFLSRNDQKSAGPIYNWLAAPEGQGH